jgi:hypothetical protein
VTLLERRCRWLLLTYPAWYRRRRGEEMLGTLLEASPPGQGWPSFRDTRALITGGLRVRGWSWLLSMLWVVAAQLAPRSCLDGGLDCRLRAHVPGRGLGRIPRERELALLAISISHS